MLGKMEANIDFWEDFFQCFFRVRVGIDFGSFFEGSEPWKYAQRLGGSTIFTKSTFFGNKKQRKIEKNLG